ncbi:hypothetical protein [Parabacteroides pacaensis]|uniref:hypothetical protein n=1 Tax=Parabacteroides pacaensis TaxID=2086575 RepID=UPI000D0E71F2|nr:hypothetical protein [Parabacteroides pacaensis]
MNITKEKMRLNKEIICILLMVLAISCQQKDMLYYITVYDSNSIDNCYNQSLIIIPIYNGKDSVYCCTLPRSFYNKVGIYLFTEEEFSKMLYKRMVENDFIRVSDSVFMKLRDEEKIVKEDEEVLKVYETQGILKVLEKYTNQYGEIPYETTSRERINYIYYLAFINHIYFYWEDEEGPGFFLGDALLKQIKKDNEED